MTVTDFRKETNSGFTTFKANNHNMKKYSICWALLLLIGCKNNDKNSLQQKSEHFVPHTKEEVQETYHVDTTYKYEYRTGESGDYQYNYNVSGISKNGVEVTGNITVENKYGKGTLIDEAGNKIDVEVEWISLGKLKAIDSGGTEYELDVD